MVNAINIHAARNEEADLDRNELTIVSRHDFEEKAKLMAISLDADFTSDPTPTEEMVMPWSL